MFKLRRIRTEFTQAHLDKLEEAFAKARYFRGKERDDLARELNVSPRSVTIWFQNRRARMRAEHRHDDPYDPLHSCKNMDEP